MASSAGSATSTAAVTSAEVENLMDEGFPAEQGANTGDEYPESRTLGARKVMEYEEYFRLHPTTPYLVLGFGRNISSRPNRDFMPYSVCLEFPGTSDEDGIGKVLWSNESITGFSYADSVSVSLPPFTDVIGAASGVACFPNGCVKQMDFDGFVEANFIMGKRYYGVKGLIYPISHPRQGRIICRRITSTLRSHPNDYLLSAGVSITKETSVAEGICEIFSVDDSVEFGENERNDSVLTSNVEVFTLLSQHYVIRYVDEADTLTLHDPFPLRDVPECLPGMNNRLHDSDNGITGICIRIKAVPYLVTLFCLILMVSPGIVQFYGSNDNSWGDIVNQIIGTGSVLLGAVAFLFHRIFGGRFMSMDGLRGRFIIHNDLAAKVFAKEIVKEIEQVACDPRMPPGVIAADKNCAVRGKRSGWLRVGNSIKLSDMNKHGYFVLQDKALILDLFEAKFYSCSKLGKVAHINRFDRQTSHNVCAQFDGDELFEGAEDDNICSTKYQFLPRTLLYSSMRLARLVEDLMRSHF